MTEKLSPLERQKYAENIKHFGELLKRGGTINALGELVLDDNTLRSVHVEENLKPQLESFKLTPEGEQIEDQRQHIKALSAVVEGYMGHAVNFKSWSSFMEISLTEWEDYAKSNGLKLDIPLTSDKLGIDGDNPEVRQKLKIAADQLSEYNNALSELELDLIDHPEIRFGSEVLVKRSGRQGSPSYIEPHWTVDSITGTADLVVVKDNLQKTVPLQTLVGWQAQATQG